MKNGCIDLCIYAAFIIFQVFLDTCIARYHSKKIEAGTTIGAQSIGEPGTQMTLKIFTLLGLQA